MLQLCCGRHTCRSSGTTTYNRSRHSGSSILSSLSSSLVELGSNFITLEPGATVAIGLLSGLTFKRIRGRCGWCCNVTPLLLCVGVKIQVFVKPAKGYSDRSDHIRTAFTLRPSRHVTSARTWSLASCNAIQCCEWKGKENSCSREKNR
uniref:Uncharacterized protein n=1 Tax=Glossina pallidipes TaxID=7398 RepID=A0A1B0AHQ7_GLOPL